MKLFEIKILRESKDISNYRGNIQTMLECGNFLYRGMDHHTGMTRLNAGELDVFAVSARVDARTAKGNSLAAAIATKWTDVPKRNLSAFATGDKASTDIFGEAYLIIPIDSVKQYGCIAGDFNYTQGAESLALVSSSLFNLYRQLIKWVGVADRTNPESTKKIALIDGIPLDNRHRPEYDHPRTIAAFDHFINSDTTLDMVELGLSDPDFIKMDDTVRTIKAELEKLKVKSLADLLHTITPEYFGIFTTTDLADVPAGIGEVWFEGDYLAVRIYDEHPGDILKQLLESIKG